MRGRDLPATSWAGCTFTEYFHLLLTGREPTEDERFFLDLLLVAIAEHGLMPSNVAARMTLAADPGLAAGRGRGRDPRRRPGAARRRPRSARGCSQRARARAGERSRDEIRDAGGKVPGFGHPVHTPVDPRAERILELADERGVSGRHVALARALRDAVREEWGRPLDDERLDADRGGVARPRLSRRRR